MKLLDLKRVLGTDDVSCVLCLSEKMQRQTAGAGAPLNSIATTYCVDCRQNYCDHCIATHEVINPLVCADRVFPVIGA